MKLDRAAKLTAKQPRKRSAKSKTARQRPKASKAVPPSGWASENAIAIRQTDGTYMVCEIGLPFKKGDAVCVIPRKIGGNRTTAMAMTLAVTLGNLKIGTLQSIDRDIAWLAYPLDAERQSVMRIDLEEKCVWHVIGRYTRLPPKRLRR